MTEPTTAVATRPNGGPIQVHRDLLTDDQIGLIKRQILHGKRPATDDELALFIGQCNRTGLDPFSNQIYGIYRWDKRNNDEKLTIQTGIDGLRLVAERTGKYVGQLGPYWAANDLRWQEAWLDAAHPPAVAKVIVRKVVAGVVAESSAVATWAEYAPASLNNFWRGKPSLMLAKCAEALALRKAFPQELSGLYIGEELAQADVTVDVPVLGQVPETGELPTAPEPELVAAKRANELVDYAWTIDVDRERFTKAVSFKLGDDAGDCSTKTAATKAVRLLNTVQADALERWLDAQVAEGADDGDA